MPTHEREITAPVDLCLPDGRLNPDAVGWTRRPLHRSNLRGWGRAKRWEYWGIVTPRHIVGLVVSSLDYAGVHSVYVLDRDTGEEISADAVVPFARGALFPDRSGEGEASARGGRVAVGVRQHPSGSRLRALAPSAGIDLDAGVPLPDGHESLGVVIPWSPHRFQHTVKDVGRPVHGRLRLPSGDHEIGPGAFAVLDHGRGKWPYRMTWNWAAASAPGLALQLGGQWTDGTGMTENALFIDGRLHKIGEDLRWTYDRTDWLGPWTITGSRVQAEFHPFHVRAARAELGIVGTDTHQCFGHFTGRAQADDGTWIDVDGLTGWAEEARQRW